MSSFDIWRKFYFLYNQGNQPAKDKPPHLEIRACSKKNTAVTLSCHIYLRYKVCLQSEPACDKIEQNIKSLVHSRRVWKISYCSFKVKIHCDTLIYTLTSQAPNSTWEVSIWRNHRCQQETKIKSFPKNPPTMHAAQPKAFPTTVSSWNCHVLANI